MVSECLIRIMQEILYDWTLDLGYLSREFNIYLINLELIKWRE